MISAYLHYAQLTTSANDSARFFTARRMTLARNIIPPSNARYAGYVGDIIRGSAPQKNSVRIEKLVLTKVPRFNSQGNGWYIAEFDALFIPIGCRPFVEIIENGNLIRSTEKEFTGPEPVLR